MKKLENMPDINIGLVGVSRDCFPLALTARRLEALGQALKTRVRRFKTCPVIVQTEADVPRVLDFLRAQKVNAAVIYLGNFGTEGPTSMLAARLDGPVMVCAAAEENRAGLRADRGDALCGLLSCSYNLKLRRARVHIPAAPVGSPEELADAIVHFRDVARVVVGVRGLKVLGFGPRPADFFACNAPLKPLMDLGVEVAENSELDLFHAYDDRASRRKDIRRVAESMEQELGRAGNRYPDLLKKLAQFEITLLDLAREQAGACAHVAIAGKCWPAFERQFGFVPCYVNGRLAARGIPVACEVDLYGAVSEFMVQAASEMPATLLDLNNSVPPDMADGIDNLAGAGKRDLFMGFHCGNTCAGCMKECRMNYQVIMNRLMEGGRKPDITRGTLEGQIKPGPTTLFRVQSTPDNVLQCCVAEGEFLDVDPCTFGGTGVLAIPGFGRFYRHILVGQGYPHHSAFAFKKVGRVLFDAAQLLGIANVHVPLPADRLYEGENPF